MEECACDNDTTKYFDVMDGECADKQPGRIYEVSNIHGETKCWDVCQINRADPRCPKPSIEDIDTLNILKIVEYLSSNINKPNPYTKSLITSTKLSIYESELSTISSEAICNLGSAKILAKGFMNSELSNIMNIYGAVIFSHTKDKDPPFNSDYSIEAMGDLGCSSGLLNLYFAAIERNYNFPKIESLDDLSRIMSVSEFKLMLRTKIMNLVDLIRSRRSAFLAIEYTPGDEIGGDGDGDFNDKYYLFYIVKFLITNKNLHTIEGLSYIFDAAIKSKFDTLNEKATSVFAAAASTASLYEQKYLKYKTKYLKLKKLLNKMK
jgi:hypothetical protein